jgi:hypothetical protein
LVRLELNYILDPITLPEEYFFKPLLKSTNPEIANEKSAISKIKTYLKENSFTMEAGT